MIASALSMGSSAFLAAKSEREIYEAEFARERDAVEYNEAEAREVLSLNYQIRGVAPGGTHALWSWAATSAKCGQDNTGEWTT